MDRVYVPVVCVCWLGEGEGGRGGGASGYMVCGMWVDRVIQSSLHIPDRNMGVLERFYKSGGLID